MVILSYALFASMCLKNWVFRLMLLEAQASPDGIPASIVEKKMEELKATGNPKKEQGTSFAKATETDWKHRYDSLTGIRIVRLLVYPSI